MTEEKRQHAQYSPSSLEKYELCPCFEPSESSNTQASEDGTRLHEATEHENFDLCESSFEEEWVHSALNVTGEYHQSLGVDNTVVYKERLLDVAGITKGSADWLGINKNRAAVIDYKFGKVPVTPAVTNPQGQGYVLGVFNDFPGVDIVDLAFVCPRIPEVTSETYYRVPDASRIERRILDIVERASDPHSIEQPSPKACQWCGKKATCPSLNSTAVTVSRGFGLPIPEEFEPGRILRPRDRAKAQILSQLLEDWGKQVRKANAKAVLEDGIEIPGFSLRSKRGKLCVDDTIGLIEWVRGKYNLDLDSVFHACSVKVPELVNQIYAQAQSEGNDEVDKKTIREELTEQASEYIHEADSIVYLQKQRGIKNEEIISER